MTDTTQRSAPITFTSRGKRWTLVCQRRVDADTVEESRVDESDLLAAGFVRESELAELRGNRDAALEALLLTDWRDDAEVCRAVRILKGDGPLASARQDERSIGLALKAWRPDSRFEVAFVWDLAPDRSTKCDRGTGSTLDEALADLFAQQGFSEEERSRMLGSARQDSGPPPGAPDAPVDSDAGDPVTAQELCDVSNDRHRWRQRAESAEARVKELEAEREMVGQDMQRIMIERDALHDDVTVRELAVQEALRSTRSAESERDQLREQLTEAQFQQRRAELGLEEFQRSAEVTADRWHAAEEQLKAREAELAARHQNYLLLERERGALRSLIADFAEFCAESGWDGHRLRNALLDRRAMLYDEPPAEQAGAHQWKPGDRVTLIGDSSGRILEIMSIGTGRYPVNVQQSKGYCGSYAATDLAPAEQTAAKSCRCAAQPPDDNRHCALHELRCPLYSVPVIVHEVDAGPAEQATQASVKLCQERRYSNMRDRLCTKPDGHDGEHWEGDPANEPPWLAAGHFAVTDAEQAGVPEPEPEPDASPDHPTRAELLSSLTAASNVWEMGQHNPFQAMAKALRSGK